MWHKLNLIWVCALAFGVLPLVGRSASPAGFCLPRVAHPNSVPHYVAALIDSLSYAKEGRERAASTTQPTTDMMLNLKLADREYECATAIVAPYADSSNEMISLSARTARTVYQSLIALDQRAVGVFRDLLDRGPGDPRWGTVSEQAAQIGAEADDAWKLLPTAVVGATYALVDPSQRGRLTVTAKDRAALLGQLDGAFGKGVRDGMKAGQFPVDAAAALLYQFLGNQEWQPQVGDPQLGANR